jgi:hypothetical protein
MEGVFIGGQNLNFLEKKFGFFRALTVKTASFLVQTVEFVFKRSNFNSNRPITSHRVRQAVVWAIPSGVTARPGSSVSGTARPGQASALPPGPIATSFRAGGSARPPDDST